MQPISERKAWRINGFLTIGVLLVLALVEVLLIRDAVVSREPSLLWAIIPVFLVIALIPSGYYLVQPNEARVLIVFGKYTGSVRDAGFWWSNPFAVKRHISLRIRNFNSERLKVNDLHGNPIEIAAVIVWRIVDSARAVFDV
ncbi:MAG TPA: SPFH domain-containing protein, partial [Bacteroidota bacterium]|nr:SPFH domain-containing protein [Bacteroidota bacterium]